MLLQMPLIVPNNLASLFLFVYLVMDRMLERDALIQHGISNIFGLNIQWNGMQHTVIRVEYLLKDVIMEKSTFTVNGFHNWKHASGKKGVLESHDIWCGQMSRHALHAMISVGPGAFAALPTPLFRSFLSCQHKCIMRM